MSHFLEAETRDVPAGNEDQGLISYREGATPGIPT